MKIVPVLAKLRELLGIPRGKKRFEEYMKLMINEKNELALPLSAFNPMSKDHVIGIIDKLIDINAEEIAKNACEKLKSYLSDIKIDLQICLVVVDDLMGGWTNRHTYEFNYLTKYKTELNLGFCSVPLWSSEPVSAQTVEIAVIKSVYRRIYHKFKHKPSSIEDFLLQEGSADLVVDHLIDENTGNNEVFDLKIEFLSKTDCPFFMSFWFGDEAAASLGYPLLGFAKNYGKNLAKSYAKSKKIDPRNLKDKRS